MVLLDSLIAFALTLAALATVVTILLEFVFRFLRLRSQDQLKLIRRLAADSFETIEKTDTAPSATLDALLRKVLKNPFASQSVEIGKGFWARWHEAGALYEDVSLEHTLRRLLEVPGLIDKKTAALADELQHKLEEVGRRYDEYRSALAERFKRNAQWWSIALGLALAVALNINGLRIFELYMQDPALRQKVIVALQPPQGSQQQPPQGSQQQPPQGSQQQPSQGAQQPTAGTTDDLEKEVDRLRNQVSLLAGIDLPIGFSYFPWCRTVVDNGKEMPSPDPRCPSSGSGFDPASKAIWAWLLQVVVTGVLIGLGAPFWYDVARRLAAVRSAFGGKGTAEDRHRGDDGKQSPWARKQLIQRIVQDFLASAKPPQSQSPPQQTP